MGHPILWRSCCASTFHPTLRKARRMGAPELLWLSKSRRLELGTNSNPFALRARFFPPGFSFLNPQARKPRCHNQCGLLRSSARGSNAKHHLRTAVQVDILLGAEQDAGSLSHPGILLPRRIVRQQHAGNRRGSDGYVAGSGDDGPSCGGSVFCRSPGACTSALRRATCRTAGIRATCAGVRRSACRRAAHGAGRTGRCRAARWSDRLNLGMNWHALTTL